jgi:hypothetical protein
MGTVGAVLPLEAFVFSWLPFVLFSSWRRREVGLVSLLLPTLRILKLLPPWIVISTFVEQLQVLVVLPVLMITFVLHVHFVPVLLLSDDDFCDHQQISEETD